MPRGEWGGTSKRRTSLLNGCRVFLVNGVRLGLKRAEPSFVRSAAIRLALGKDADEVLDLLGLADEVGQELALRGLDDRPGVGVRRLKGDG